MRPIRNTPQVGADLAPEFVSFYTRVMFSHFGSPAIGDGTTDGTLRTNASVTGRVAGVDFTKASTDDLWDLSAQTDTTAAQYRAFWLYVNAAGTASIAASANSATAAGALAALPALDAAKCVFGVYVADPSCDFNGAAGLEAQGTVYDGIPAGANLGGLVLATSVDTINIVKP